MSKAFQLANLSQKAVRNLLLKNQLSPLKFNLILSPAVVQKRSKSYYGEPKLYKENSEILLSTDDEDASKWKIPPANSMNYQQKISSNYILNYFYFT